MNLSRSYGRAPSSERVIDHAPRGKKERSSLIAAVTNRGLEPTHCLVQVENPQALTSRYRKDFRPEVHPDSVNKSAFLSYLEKVLLPALEPGSILVMDN